MAERDAPAPDVSEVPSSLEFVEGLEQVEDVPLEALVTAQRARRSPLDIFTRLEEEAGVPDLRAARGTLTKEVETLEDQLERVESDVALTSRESLLTEAQRRRAVTEQRQPLADNLSKLGISLSRIGAQIDRALQGITTKTGLAIQGQEQVLEPLKLVLATTIDRNTRKLSGFTTDRQTALDTIWAKWTRDNQLEDNEWQLASQLAVLEKGHLFSLQELAASSGGGTGGNIDELLRSISSRAVEAIAFERGIQTRTLDISEAKGAKDGGGGGTDLTNINASSGFTFLGEDTGGFAGGITSDLLFDQTVFGGSATLK